MPKKRHIEDIVQERNLVIARLTVAQNVDLSLSDWDSFIPDRKTQVYALADLTDMVMDFYSVYTSLSLQELFHYCKVRFKLSEKYSGVSKKDVLRLLGLVESYSDLDLLFDGML